LEDNNNILINRIKKNLFNEFNKRDDIKMFLFDNIDLKAKEEIQRIKKEEYYDNLINQVNLFESFKKTNKRDNNNERKKKIFYEKEEDSFEKNKREGKIIIYLFIIFKFFPAMNLR
jgi:hypothetical protein